jgi:hypothetical protein
VYFAFLASFSGSSSTSSLLGASPGSVSASEETLLGSLPASEDSATILCFFFFFFFFFLEGISSLEVR